MAIEVVPPEVTPSQIGYAMLLMRKHLKYGQEELAEVTEMTVSSYSRTEGGTRTLKFAEAVVLCEFYGITEDDFLEICRLIDPLWNSKELPKEALNRFISKLDQYEQEQSASTNT